LLTKYKINIVLFYLKSPDDVLKMGIANYNLECRQIVMRYSNEWQVSFQTNYCPEKRSFCVIFYHLIYEIIFTE